MNTQAQKIAADYISELTREHTTTERIDRFVPVPNVTQPPWHVPAWTKTKERHVTTHPSLIDQLKATVGQSRQGDFSGGSAKSKPAARLDAIATLARIDKQSRQLATELNVTGKGMAARLSAIAGALGTNPNDTVRNWWISARCVTGWEEPTYEPDVPCPNVDCERRASLRIRPTEGIGSCIECGSTWGEENFATLGEYIKWASEHLTGPRHWLYDAEGYPIECVVCLTERQVMAERKATRGRVHATDLRKTA